MSKASEWSGKYQTVWGEWSKFQARDGTSVALVDTCGNLAIENYTPILKPDEAIAFARWILDTFGP